MPTPEQALESAEFLQEQGFAIPNELLELIQTEIHQKHQVRQLWFCKKCHWSYKSMVNLSAVACREGHPMTLKKKYLEVQP